MKGVSKPMAGVACLLLAACATAPAPLELREVDVPTPTPCAVKIGPAPDYPDTDAALAAAPGLFERVQRLLAGRLLRIAREAELTAALGGVPKLKNFQARPVAPARERLGRGAGLSDFPSPASLNRGGG